MSSPQNDKPENKFVDTDPVWNFHPSHNLRPGYRPEESMKTLTPEQRAVPPGISLSNTPGEQDGVQGMRAIARLMGVPNQEVVGVSKPELAAKIVEAVGVKVL